MTRSADKIVFKVPTKILPIYEYSPYYILNSGMIYPSLPKMLPMFMHLKKKFDVLIVYMLSYDFDIYVYIKLSSQRLSELYCIGQISLCFNLVVFL